jgi:hypothetical protein
MCSLVKHLSPFTYRHIKFLSETVSNAKHEIIHMVDKCGHQSYISYITKQSLCSKKYVNFYWLIKDLNFVNFIDIRNTYEIYKIFIAAGIVPRVKHNILSSYNTRIRIHYSLVKDTRNLLIIK